MSPSRGWLCGVLAAFMCMVGCFGGTNDDMSPVVTSPHAGIDVRFLVPAGLGLPESWRPALNDWEVESGGTSEIVEFDFSTAEEGSLAEQLSTRDASLVLLPSPLVNPLVAEDLIAPIPQQILDEGVIAWSSIPPPVRQSLGTLGQVPSMVPVTCPVPVCCYRADLLQAAGKQVPATWEEYDALVTTVAEWAPGLVAVEPWAEPFRTTTFLSRAISAAKHPAQYSVELDVSSGEPLIGTAPFLRTLEEVLSLKPHLAETVHLLSPDECLRELRQGRAAMGIVWETTTAVETTSSTDQDQRPADTTSQSLTDVPLTFAPLPGRGAVYDRETDQWTNPPIQAQNRPALCGPGGFTVCTLSTAAEGEQLAAWELWGLLESYQLDGTIKRVPGNSVIPSRIGTAPSWNGLSLEQWQQLQQAVEMSFQNPLLVCELPVWGQRQLQSDLSEGLALASRGNETPEKALHQVARQWSTAIDELGRSQVLNSYRRRLGLSPLPD